MVNEAMIDLISDIIKVNIKENKTPDKINHIIRKFLTIVNKKNEPSRPKDVFKTSIKRLFFGLRDALYWSEMEVATTFLEKLQRCLVEEVHETSIRCNKTLLGVHKAFDCMS